MKKLLNFPMYLYSLNKYSFLIIYFILLGFSLLITYLGIDWAYYLLIIVIGVGYNQVIFHKNISFTKNILLSWFTSTAILIVYASLLNLIKLAFNNTAIVYYIIMTIIFLILNRKKFIFSHIQIELDRWDLVAFFIALIAIVAKVVSLRTFNAPILHDPISHAEWAKIIVSSGYVTYFYSPGLHILAATGELIGSFDVAKQILIISNIFNALIGIPIYILIRLYLKKPWWAIFAVILFSLGPYPMNFYVTAGKNALLVAISLIFCSFITLTINRKNNLLSVVFTNVFILALILTHYPTGLIGSIFIGFYILFKRHDVKRLLFLIPAYLIGTYWGITKYILYNRKTLNPIYSSSFEKVTDISFQHTLNILSSTWRQALVFIELGWLGKTILILGSIGLIILFISSINKKETRWAVFGLVSYIVIMLGIETFNFTEIFLVRETQIIFSFVFFYLSASFILGEVLTPYIIDNFKYTKIILISLLLILSLSVGNQIYRQYQAIQLELNMVADSDLKVFEWIKSNIGLNEIILNNGVMGPRVGIVFQTDAGAWIPAYTSRKIAIPFSEFDSQNTYDNYLIHQELMKDPSNCAALNNLLKKDINYYFKAKKSVFGASLIIDTQLLEKDFYELVYQSGESKLYRIIGCKE